MKRNISNGKLYRKYILMNLKSGFQYRGWWMRLLQTFLVVISDPISTVLMFHRFGSIGVWSMERILLIYAVAVTDFGLAELFCRGFDTFPYGMVRSGDFDRLLLRPRSLFLQVAASKFHLHRLTRVLSGLCVIGWALYRMQVQMTVMRWLLLLGALAGGLILYSGVFVLTSGISFFTIQGIDWIYIFTNAGYQVTRCPVEYMPRALYGVFTFLIPVLVISYYPMSTLCGWGEPLWKGLMALPVGIGFMVLAQIVWKTGVRHYQSTGS